MANSEDVQRDEERRTLIRLALGKASVAFMRQSAEVVMPTEELLEVAEDIHAVWALEVDNLAAAIRELRRDRARLDAILARRKVAAWNEELGYSVELENREMVDAWLEDLGGGEGEA